MGDGILAELTSVNFHAIFSMDLVPIPQELALRKLQAALTNNEMAISKEQDMKNKYRAFSSDITYAKRRKKEELEYYLDQFHTNDQKMFYLGFTIVVYGKDDKELKYHVQTIRSMGKGIQFEVLEWRQLKGFHTSLPIGTRQVDIMRTVFTTSMAAFIPFNVQELFDTNGLYYGVNKVSKNLILADRKSLKNGNGFTFGLTGSGKSMDNKSELCQVYYQTKDRMIICDPQGEYKEICANLEGEYIDFSLEGDKYMNPLEIPEYIDAHFNQEQFILDKYEFLQSLCRSVLDPLPYTANHNSVVERCTRKLYQNIFAKKNPESPTIEDLREYLGAQIEPEAKSLYLALEAFTEGSLNIFGRKGNVNLQNRLLVFGLGQVRDSLKKQALLVLNETIRSQIEYNNQQNICTWVWMDEFQIITKETYGAMAFNNLYRTVRKKGGILTGITQTLSDNIFNEDMQAMLNNCEYISVLSQAGIDRDLLRKVLPEITEEELGFITNAEKGCGIRRFGEKIIPFDNTIPPDNPLYELFNTNFFERQRKGHENETSNTRKTEA